MVKGFIVCNPKLYSGIEGLLDSKVWYNKDEILRLLEKFVEIMRLNNELKLERLLTNKARLNGEIRVILEGLFEND